MPKNKKIDLLKNINIIVYLIILFVILYYLRYYIAYTIDYLIYRDSYIFKEEGQFKDNNIKQNDYFLSNYLNYMRNEKIKNMQFIDSVPLVEVKIEDLNPDYLSKISNNFTKPFVVRG